MTDDAARSHIRGSSLMLVGRLIAMAVNLAVQLITVRYLSKSDYGIFAYALSVASLGASLTLLGQPEALSRQSSRFLEHDRPGRARGALAVAFGLVTLLGVALVLVVVGLDAGGVQLSSDERATEILVLMIALAPVTALDTLFVNAFAVAAKPKIIFLRRFILTPVLRLVSILTVIAASGSVRMLAWAYVISGAAGLLLFVGLLLRALRDGSFGRPESSEYPVREMVGFGAPLMVSDVVQALRATLVVIFLEAFQSVVDVASFRAVVPVAQLNLVAMQSFRLLYLPSASRLHAAGDTRALSDLYWRSAAWLAAGTFPIFIATFSMADPLTDLLFGSRYESSSMILAILAAGYFFHAALGLNAQTLKAIGAVRSVVVADGITAAVALGLNIWLISQYGALGAAIATCAAFVLQNTLVHISLRRQLDGFAVPRRYLPVYGTAITVSVLLLGVIEGLSLTPAPAIGLVLGGCGVMFAVALRTLELADTLPELRRIPVAGRWVR